jgi:8-oxo-dGTP pyrophosphatase MutT (NUDIX family)
MSMMQAGIVSLMKIVAKLLVIDQKNNVLLLRRGTTHPHFPGHYDLPGGEVDGNEAPHDAVVRELKEETGLVIDRSLVNHRFSKQYATVEHILYEVSLPADVSAQDITLSWEHQAYEWRPLNAVLHDTLTSDLDRYYVDVIEHMRDQPTDQSALATA